MIECNGYTSLGLPIRQDLALGYQFDANLTCTRTYEVRRLSIT